MFFGNSRISFIKNIITLIGDPTNNNYVVTFIDEAITDYTNQQGTGAGSFWQADVENFQVAMVGRNANSYVVFDIEADSPQNYIWPVNTTLPVPRPPFPIENIVEIFRPNQQTQQEFYETVLSNLESRWGSGIWQNMAQNGNKLLLVVDNSGSMDLPLIQTAIDLLKNYVEEKGVSVYILSGCSNERWLAWGAAAYIDGEDASCTSSCNWGIRCRYGANCDNQSADCHGSMFEICIPPYIYASGQITANSCASSCTAQEIPGSSPVEYVDDYICPTFSGGPSIVCTLESCPLISSSCGGCSLPTYCSVCTSPTGGDRWHKCVKCHYLSSEERFQENPVFTFNSITACGIAHCSVTAGTFFGLTSWDGTVWSWINATSGFTGPALFGNICHDSFEDASQNCGVCPVETENQDLLWFVEVCGTGCTNCGTISNLPTSIGTINSIEYNVCTVLGCTS